MINNNLKNTAENLKTVMKITAENTERSTNPVRVEAQKISNQEIVDILELPAIKIHCSVLAEEAIHRAIDDFKSRRNND